LVKKCREENQIAGFHKHIFFRETIQMGYKSRHKDGGKKPRKQLAAGPPHLMKRYRAQQKELERTRELCKHANEHPTYIRVSIVEDGDVGRMHTWKIPKEEPATDNLFVKNILLCAYEQIATQKLLAADVDACEEVKKSIQATTKSAKADSDDDSDEDVRAEEPIYIYEEDNHDDDRWAERHIVHNLSSVLGEREVNVCGEIHPVFIHLAESDDSGSRSPTSPSYAPNSPSYSPVDPVDE